MIKQKFIDEKNRNWVFQYDSEEQVLKLGRDRCEENETQDYEYILYVVDKDNLDLALAMLTYYSEIWIDLNASLPELICDPNFINQVSCGAYHYSAEFFKNVL